MIKIQFAPEPKASAFVWPINEASKIDQFKNGGIVQKRNAKIANVKIVSKSVAKRFSLNQYIGPFSVLELVGLVLFHKLPSYLSFIANFLFTIFTPKLLKKYTYGKHYI